MIAHPPSDSIVGHAELEQIQPSFGSSISYRRFSHTQPNSEASWHYHPEIELVYIERGSGKRHVGNHISYYKHGDLLLIGSNVPHYGFTERFTERNVEVILQFKPDFLGAQMADVVEMGKIADLLDRAQHGLSFSGAARRKVGVFLNAMSVMNQFDRMLSTLQILDVLSRSEDYDILNVSKVTLQAQQQDAGRMKLIYRHVRLNFQQEITLQEMAELTHMTVPSFCRYFKQKTGRTFTQFVNEFKVIHACKLLSETGYSIANICFECGFNNFSHFNKQFKSVTGESPSAYRAQFKQVIG